MGMAGLKNPIGDPLWQLSLRETVGLSWPLGEQNDHKSLSQD